jgi:hypothetical protein
MIEEAGKLSGDHQATRTKHRFNVRSVEQFSTKGRKPSEKR